MVGQTVDASFRELHWSVVYWENIGLIFWHLFAARLAGMLVTIAGVLELLSSLEELRDESIWLSTHNEKLEV